MSGSPKIGDLRGVSEAPGENTAGVGSESCCQGLCLGMCLGRLFGMLLGMCLGMCWLGDGLWHPAEPGVPAAGLKHRVKATGARPRGSSGNMGKQ